MVSVHASSEVDLAFESRGGVKPKYNKIGICCFSAKYRVLRSKTKTVIRITCPSGATCIPEDSCLTCPSGATCIPEDSCLTCPRGATCIPEDSCLTCPCGATCIPEDSCFSEQVERHVYQRRVV
jgi:hypothetical protein